MLSELNMLLKLKSIADETRLLIVQRILSHRKTVSEIVSLAGKSQPNVSIALKQLLHAGLIVREKEGRFVYYRLADPVRMKKLLRLLQ